MAFWNNKKKEKRELQYISPCNVSGALAYFPIGNNYSPLSLSAVYRASELISNSIATLPIKILVEEEVGKNEDKKHPLNYIFSDRNQNNLYSRFTLIKLLVQSVLLRGNGFALIERQKNGKPTNLRYLESNDVNIVYDKVKNTLYYDIPFLNRRVEPKDIIHLIMFSYDGIRGLSVLQNAARSLQIAQASENAANNYFSNGGKLDGILKVQGPLNRQQREDIRTAWNETYTSNGSGIAILQGNMDYQHVQATAKESQMLESREYSVQDIARFFGISPVLLGDLSKSSYSSLEAVLIDFLLHCLQPYISMIEAEFNKKLLTPKETNLNIILDTNEILRTDKAAQSVYYSTLIGSGVLSVNEVRKELGYNGIGDDGDKHIVAYTDISQNTIESSNEINEEDGK